MFNFLFKKKISTGNISSDQIKNNIEQPISFKSVNLIERPKLSRSEIRERKWEKLQRRTLRWGVLRHYIMHDSLNNLKHIAELKRWMEHWKNMKDIVSGVNDFELNEYDFQVLNRFISLERYKGECNVTDCPTLTLNDYKDAKDPEIDKVAILLYNNYETYWDKVLENYKRTSDKKKRLIALVDDLNHDLNSSLSNISEVHNLLTGMIEKYQQLLEDME